MSPLQQAGYLLPVPQKEIKEQAQKTGNFWRKTANFLFFSGKMRNSAYKSLLDKEPFHV